MGNCAETIPYIVNLTAYELRFSLNFKKWLLTYHRRKPIHLKGPIRGFAVDVRLACTSPRWQKPNNFLPSWKPACRNRLKLLRISVGVFAFYEYAHDINAALEIGFAD